MNAEIKRENWTGAFQELSKLRYRWNTRIEILSKEIGDQVLIDKLPLNGITVETRDSKVTIDISIGETKEMHQSHIINDPSRIAFLQSDSRHGDILDIEQKDGTKTLIYFLEPMGLLLGFKEMIAAAAAN